MKRSAHLRLSLMAAAAPLAITGCDSAPTGSVVQSLAECTALGQVTAAECELAYTHAQTEHRRVAPRFESQRDCDKQFGTCETVDEYGRAFWIPPMAGFLVGYAATRRDDDHAGGGAYLYRYRGSVPLYRERSGAFYNTRGDKVASKLGPVRAKADAIYSPARAVTVSRSGFGSTASARSSFGG